jgi:hypothetical protein
MISDFLQMAYRLGKSKVFANLCYVHAQGMSRFVSYADFPPVVGAIKLMLSAIDLELLRKVYGQEKSLLEHF